MDREIILEHLALAEGHVAAGEANISRLVAVLTNLKGGGHDVALAEATLQSFREIQATFIADRDRLLALSNAS